MQIRTKRIYEDAKPSDGVRILIDRVWPRGISKERAALDYWARDLSPSTELRRWYAHDHSKWKRFRERYFAELDDNPKALADLRAELSTVKPNTIVFASREEEFNNATALVQYLERVTPTGGGENTASERVR